MGVPIELIRDLPKVALHDHLDGGLRPDTVAELAAEIGHPLPEEAWGRVADWFFEAASSGSLPSYLKTFDHTVSLMQTAAALERVAHESVLDQAADGVIYAETRWAPEQHTRGGLSMGEAVRAVSVGLAKGQEEAADNGHRIVARQLLASLRQTEPTEAVAALVVSGDSTVVGFDLVGPEDGFPPSRHAAACALVSQHNGHITIHAGEAFGPKSIWEAIYLCGAERLGHGVRIAEDIDLSGTTPVLGYLADYVRERRIALEICPSSNLQTGVVGDLKSHPVSTLIDLGFCVTISCDNRLMSRTNLSRELWLLSETFGYGLEDLRQLQVNAARNAFSDLDVRRELVQRIVAGGPQAPVKGQV